MPDYQQQTIGTNPSQNIQQQIDFQSYTYNQSEQVKINNKKRVEYIVLIILCAFFLITTIITTVIAIKIADKADDYKNYYYKYVLIEDEYNFLHEYAFVSNSGDSYYHHYMCDNFDEDESFFILNKNLAESEGLKTCPDCIE